MTSEPAHDDTPPNPREDDAVTVGIRSESDADIDALAAHLRELGAETENQRRVKRIIPWVSSLAIHAALILIGFLVVVGYRLLPEDPVTIIANFNDLEYQPFVSTSLNQDQADQTATQDRLRSESIADTLTEQLRDVTMDPLALISDAASSSEMAEFAPQPRQGTARFAGLTGSNARKIVFIVDASGSMITTFGIVIEELARSIDNLVADQSFQVVFFQKNEALPVPPGGELLRASNEEKLRALAWIDANVIPEGRSNPIEAIKHGLSLKPDVIFLLSNDITGSGQFEIDQNDLLAMIEALNPIDPETGQRTTQIQCVQFLDHDPLDTLRKIAIEHSGEHGYKFLDRRELGIQ
ncbi:MAG: hypothetical protein ACR2GY_07895 [Phycisphaerales bacterium]